MFRKIKNLFVVDDIIKFVNYDDSELQIKPQNNENIIYVKLIKNANVERNIN